jgi:hypothetical protein
MPIATGPSNDAQITTISVYGYSSAKTPFPKEARRKKLNSDHRSLLLSVTVSCGQKLLLIEPTNGDPIEGEVVMTRPVGVEMSEVAVALMRR